MLLLVVLKAAVAAAAVSLPPGPAVALCGAHLRRRGTAAGAAAAFGAALADISYGLLAARGIALSSLEPRLRCVLGVVLAFSLGAAGIVALKRARKLPAPRPSGSPLARGFLLALAAPGVLPAYLVLHAALGLGPRTPFGAVALGTALGCGLAWGAIVLALRRYAARAPRIFEYVLPAALLVGGLGILGSALR